MTSVRPFAEIASVLVDVATGRRPADLVVKNGRWVNVYSGEILPNTDIAAAEGRFAFAGEDASHCIGPETDVIDADGRYLVPGLIDGHMHVESGMITVTEFCRAVIRHGSTSLFIDPHEIANVLGLEGVRLMHDEAMTAPINVYVQMPSCVPSAPGLENAGAELGPDDVAEAMNWPNIVGLGEVMNFPGVAGNDPKMVGEIAASVRAGKTIGGHYARPVLDQMFHGYVAAGPADDHEGTCVEDAIARVRQGMRPMLRLGSAWYDVASQIKAVTEHGLDPRHFILCTDDCHSGTLVHDGHINRAVRNAIEQGLKPINAIQMATINTAQHFGMEREIGSIAPGRLADFLIVSDLPAMAIDQVYARGRLLAEDGRLVTDVPAYVYPDKAKNTVRVSKTLSTADFDIEAPAGAARVRARVIGVIENQAPTRALEAELAVEDGVVQVSRTDDVCQVALVERHRGTGAVVNGFVSGFRYKADCAMASTIAHDSHQMIVVGTSKEDMAKAANRLVEAGGGVAFFREGKEQALIDLPIAGLMSDRRAEVVAEQADQLSRAMRDAGCDLNNANIQHTFLALVVIPEIRISDLGIVDVTKFETVDLFVS